MPNPNITITALPGEIRSHVEPIVQLAYPVQGATSAVAVIHSRNGMFVVKRATGTKYREWLQREYAVLRALAATRLPVPRVYTYVEHSHQHHHEDWLLMDWLPGEPLRAMLRATHYPAIRAVLLADFGRVLATIHRCEPPPQLALPDQRWLDRTLERAAYYLQHDRVDGTADLLQHLHQHRPPPTRETLIHGDYTLDNVLVKDQRICGIIDWAGGAIGDPRYDLALATRPHPEAFQTADDRAAFYMGYGGERLTEAEMAYFVGIYEFF
ncbi:MAG: phosphotransferase family protein [Roseiflexaceae bacterium]